MVTKSAELLSIGRAEATPILFSTSALPSRWRSSESTLMYFQVEGNNDRARAVPPAMSTTIPDGWFESTWATILEIAASSLALPVKRIWIE